MLRLIVLGALGYAGYKYLGSGKRADRALAEHSAVAGGPLSKNAAIQRDPDRPPAADPFG